MSENTAISLKNVSKVFKRYHRPEDRLKEILLPGKSRAAEFWALRNISFEISRGETIGIIGRNGSGKSTLLQIIAKTLTPTQGEVQVKGRVSALLELGSGFNPEFTGRQNVFFNGRVLGLSKEEIIEKFDDIAAFADIGDFIDQPVKTYSSGMFVRLAFAVAVHVEPEIFIVDEALAVGDIFFQAKCMARMRQMMDCGTTVLFVSHDTSSVRALCQRCAFLENGFLKQLGKASDVVSAYISLMHADINQALKEVEPEEDVFGNSDLYGQNLVSQSTSPEEESLLKLAVSLDKNHIFTGGTRRYGDGGARILDVKLLNAQRHPIHELDVRELFLIQISIFFEKKLSSFCVGYSFRDLKGQQLIGNATTGERLKLPSVDPGDIYVAEIAGVNPLNAGNYTLSVGVELPVLVNQQHILIDVIEEAVVFQVSMPINFLERFPAMVYIPVRFSVANAKNLHQIHVI